MSAEPEVQQFKAPVDFSKQAIVYRCAICGEVYRDTDPSALSYPASGTCDHTGDEKVPDGEIPAGI